MSFSSLVRQPRLAVRVAGETLTGAVAADVLSTNHFGADRFAVEAAVNADPQLGAAFWARAADLPVEIAMSLDGGLTFTTVLQGSVDQVELDVVRGAVRLEGRDLTSRLIEARTQETFQNRTSSEIATMLAGRHGLSADVTATTTLVGRYFASEHDSVTLDQFGRQTTEWDLLVLLARLEQFDVRVRQTTLSFHPPATASAALVTVTPADVISLRAERNLTLAGGVEVTVRSWNARQQTVLTQSAAQPAADGAQAAGAPRSYVYVAPNLSTDQAIGFARQSLAEIVRHERAISLVMPGELSLMAGGVLELQGTGTAIDQAYVVDAIDRRISVDDGFVQRVRASGLTPAGS